MQAAIDREIHKRNGEIKPIEIVKIAISAYQTCVFAEEGVSADTARTQSSDKADLGRGTQAAVDRMLFNANYWRSAYEQQIIEACSLPSDALSCLRAVSVWTTHTLKLNTLSSEETIAIFERFSPPFRFNNRRGTNKQNGTGKGPLPDFRKAIDAIRQKGDTETSKRLEAVLARMEKEAAAYDKARPEGPLSALFCILPAWCIQNRIELVSGPWWDDYDVMLAIVNALKQRFTELGFGDAVCRYFLDSCCEALDAYHRDLTSEINPLSELEVSELIDLVEEARNACPGFETDGYDGRIPSWLISKEQLIWNVVICSIYGPASARPLLADSPELLSSQGYAGKTDVLTELAKTSFDRYTGDRTASQLDREFESFASLPPDLRSSSIAYISSIHSKLETLGYEVLPAGSCYPDRYVSAFTDSEVECLAILEHRRWLRERQKAGWDYGEVKNVDAKQSPYMVPWEQLPDRAKEWNRSAVRSIPALLASVNLAVVK